MSWYDFTAETNLLTNNFLNSDLCMPILCIVLALIIYILYKNRKRLNCFQVKDITVFNISINSNTKNVEIVYKMYVQLKTRKIGIKFDDENDVLIEVYDSWYSAFCSIRELMMGIKPTYNNKDIINVGDKILNKFTRPHLTKWQAKFRKWYEYELDKEENYELSPQEIQKKYVYYDDLVKDLKKSQEQILIFLDQIEQIFV